MSSPTYYVPVAGIKPPCKDAIPVHQCTIYLPGIGTQHINTPASHRIAGVSAFCKYCSKRSRNWWQMPEPDNELVLCGNCGYTHLKEMIA